MKKRKRLKRHQKRSWTK